MINLKGPPKNYQHYLEHDYRDCLTGLLKLILIKKKNCILNEAALLN